MMPGDLYDIMYSQQLIPLTNHGMTYNMLIYNID